MNFERDEGRERMNTAAAPFPYNHAAGSNPHLPDARAMRHRASTAPVTQSPSMPHNVSPLPYYPSFLAPGYRNGPQTVHKADIFFAHPVSSSVQHNSNTSVQQPSRYNTFAPTVPYETHPHRSATLPTSPPLPPKPAELATRITPYPSLSPSISVSSSPPTASAVSVESQSLSDDSSVTPADSDLAIALALSESESHQQQEYLQKLAEKEEEELARALAASLADSGPSSSTEELERALAASMHVDSFNQREDHGAGSSTSHILPAIRQNHIDYSEAGPSQKNLPLSSTNSLKSSSHEFLEEDDRDGPRSDESELPYLNSGFPPAPTTSIKLSKLVTINKDEDSQQGGSSPISSYPLTSSNILSDENGISASISGPLKVGQDHSFHARTVDSSADEEARSPLLPITYPQLSNSGHSLASSDSISVSSSSLAATSVKELPSDDNASLMSKNSSHDSASGSVPARPLPSRNLSATSSNMTTMNLNQFVDAELLFGVSIGFNPPTISTTQVPMQGALPNIISLPYGKAPPLHIQAPSWRQTLRLLARMSGSRMEPAVEAMAVTKSEMKLRTVVQFFKPHHTSPEWRTILWFTIDYPIPPDTPNAHKYHAHNINTLPWSYTFSKTPDLLQDAADTALSKVYVIPATDAVPYPLLPITLPNLAIYLQAALDDSRKYINDSSSGLRKLAKMVQMCYPTGAVDYIPEPAERTGMSGLLKRVMGRNNKASKTGRGGNEDTYELVTPFVPDEWG